MRDPRGSLRLDAQSVTRTLHRPLTQTDFLHSALSARWVTERRLVPFEIVDTMTIVSPRLTFVSLPEEWCDLQAHDAARFTLALQAEANAGDFDLKDASAWNVLFDGASPLFCDLLSFEPLATRPWWAAGQFSRHFLLPLLAARKRGFHAGDVLRVWRDGMPPAAARSMLGVARFLTRYWPLMAEGLASTDDAAAVPQVIDPAALAPVRRYRESLLASFDWMLTGVRPSAGDREGVWASYESERGHYVDSAMTSKRQVVAEWLQRVAPAWVADLGCNAGEFSLMARDSGAQVVAIDADHAAVQRLYRRVAGTRGIHPVRATFDDLCGGRGWSGAEFAGLAARMEGRFDLVMMLALVHHLAVGASIPLVEIARFVHRSSRGWALIELIGSDDPQMRLLCSQRRRDAAEFGLTAQREAFLRAGFEINSEVVLSGASRSLALMRKL